MSQPPDSDLMKNLNERFANYINKIRSLENQKSTLQMKIKHLQSSESKKTAQFEQNSSKLTEVINTLKEEKCKSDLQIIDLTERLQRAENKITELQEEKETEIKELTSEISSLSVMVTDKDVEISEIKSNRKSLDDPDGDILDRILSKVREEVENMTEDPKNNELVEQLESKVDELEKENTHMKLQLTKKEHEIQIYLKNYKSLQSNEMSLKAEIFAYRAMLELEEKRVNSEDGEQ